MAINFPTSPSTNDTFTAGFITYKWDGVKWIGLGVTPETDRLVEGSNSLEINASNELVWTGGVVKISNSVDLTDSTVDLYSQTTNAASKTFQLFSDIGGTKTEKVYITANGAATLADEIKIQGASTPAGLSSRISKYGSLLIGTSSDAVGDARCSIDSGNGNITSVGTATLGGVCKVDRTVSGDGCFHAALNGTVNASITSAGYAVFSGGEYNNEVYINGTDASTQRYLNFNRPTAGQYRATLRRDAWYLGENVGSIGNVTPTGANITLKMNGDIVVGKSSSSLSTSGLEIASAGQLRITRGTNGDFVKFYHTNGSQVGAIRNIGGTTTDYIETSDYRLKENVVDITDGITRLKQLQPRRFNFIVDPDTTVDGFIAHEAQSVVPQAVCGTKDEVDENNDPVLQGIDKSKLVPLLTAALQEAVAEIETLKGRLDAAGL